MKPHPFHRSTLSLILIASLSACGGGGGSTASSGGTATTTTTAGQITGFGSVIVNGVRYSETSATVDSDDDASYARANLQLGMVVEIDGDVNSDGVTGKARSIRARSETEGSITAIDTTAKTLTVMGQIVAVNAQTVFPGGTVQPSQLSDLSVNERVEVHGLRTDATHITATHIERKAIGLANKIRGTVSALDATAKTFILNGTLTVNYTGVSLPAGMQNGSFVKVLAATAPVANVLQATRITISGRESNESHAAGQHSEIKGAVTDFSSISNFKINGVKVDASGARLPSGHTIAAGDFVEVKGSYNSAGALVATKLTWEGEVQANEAYELKGPITDFVSSSNFKVKGVLVDAHTVTLTAGTWGNGLYVEVKGAMSGQTLIASRLKTENVERLDD
jgi:hypothetical protein